MEDVMAPRAVGSIALLASGLILSAAVPASAGMSGWRDSYADGSVTVPADRSSIRVCDGKDDSHVYKAVWHNDNPIDARKAFEVRAPQGGCATDDSFWGSVKVFKLCYGYLGANRLVVWDGCKASVWPGGH
ncbi:hypothetical protein ACIHFD_60920 [Nonomuraea sp. NPDC051941]|uniref:hypothetical protein n=1 Tax=Nonomuraea sp. NPDC051941 TaxID=3364373 RepID=UPI0037C6D95F